MKLFTHTLLLNVREMRGEPVATLVAGISVIMRNDREAFHVIDAFINTPAPAKRVAKQCLDRPDEIFLVQFVARWFCLFYLSRSCVRSIYSRVLRCAGWRWR